MLPCGMQSFEECDKRCRFGGAEIFPVRGHVAAALNNLADQLVFGENDGDLIESRSAFAALIPQRVAIVTLLQLKDDGALTLECGTVPQKFRRYRIATPGIHFGTPRSVTRKTGEFTEHDRNQENGQHGDRPATPTFFAFTEHKRQS
jgi:hypothetical protein